MSIRALALLPLLIACQTEDDPGLSLIDTESYMDQEVLVSVGPDDDGVARMLLSDGYGLDELEHNAQIGVVRMSIDDRGGQARSVKDVARVLEQDFRVNFAEPNYVARTTGISSDTYVDVQWNLPAIDAAEAWQLGTGTGVTVAVLDTGVRPGGTDGITHLLPGYDFYNGDSNPTDGDGHGTFVAGTIGQKTNNSRGVAGVAPDANILPVKVMSDQGYGDINAIANGITWSTDQGARVINMSLGSNYPSRTLEQACQYAYDRGVTLVAATGNEYASQVGYPAGYDTVIAVGASRYDGQRAGYSNTGTGIALVAPGGDLSRDQNGDGYADGIVQETWQQGWTYTIWEGTSMATPHVAAVAALILEQGDYSPAEVLNILTSTATDSNTTGYDTQTGYGVVNAGAAVALAARGTAVDPPDGGDDSGDSGDTGSTTPDTTAPTISQVNGRTDGNSFTITWVTDEPATSYIDFTDYGEFGDDELTTSHTLQFRARAGQRYNFDLKSTDAAGNTGTSGTWYVQL